MDIEKCQKQSSIIMNECDEESTSGWYVNGDGSISSRCNWELGLEIQSDDSTLVLANIAEGLTNFKISRA